MDGRAISRTMVPGAPTRLHAPRDLGACRRARVRWPRARRGSHHDLLRVDPRAALSGLDDAHALDWLWSRTDGLRSLAARFLQVSRGITMPAISRAVESIDQHEALAAATSAECDPIGSRQCFSEHHQLVPLDVRRWAAN